MIETLRSFDHDALTAYDINRRHTSSQMAALIPTPLHHISEATLKQLESQLHHLIRETAGDLV